MSVGINEIRPALMLFGIGVAASILILVMEHLKGFIDRLMAAQKLRRSKPLKYRRKDNRDKSSKKQKFIGTNSLKAKRRGLN